ncbi:SymE family type I addiction module toxin [Citrobacter portucalensis]|uniref:SymE family type I addiction module toxin n=1 Tax=Citrobacter portucalensis TaxID=1639133 RepID=UPI002B23ADD4|nr:SymE family type I addiction module toxin [Citrobacter portucalensis]MEB0900986.1 SymE family type I addiction module toxin [Citrobacter portucalensis]
MLVLLEQSYLKLSDHLLVLGFLLNYQNSRNPSLHLKGNWLEEAGFETGRGVTVKISDGCIVLMADCNEVQELREQLYLAKQVVKGIKDGMFSMLNGD